VVEGIYYNTGRLCNIERMIDLKRRYKLRLFIDESVSFGTLGEHGRGITEYKNISVRESDIHVIVGARRCCSLCSWTTSIC
jgi:serine palmitoyltransferase